MDTGGGTKNRGSSRPLPPPPLRSSFFLRSSKIAAKCVAVNRASSDGYVPTNSPPDSRCSVGGGPIWGLDAGGRGGGVLSTVVLL